MPGAECILDYENSKEKSDELIADAELIFTLDFNTASRMGKMADAVLNASAVKILVDHHLHPDEISK